MTDEAPSIPSLEDVVAAAERARAAFDWEAAIAASGRALARQGIPPETAYAVLDTRAEAHRLLGDMAAEGADLEAMARLAGEMGDVRREARVRVRQSDVRWRQGDFPEARRLAQAALEAAKTLEDGALEAASLVAMNAVEANEGFFDLAREEAERAVALCHTLGDVLGEARALFALSVTYSRQERMAEATAHNRASLELFRRAGDREGEGRLLNSLGISSTDLARRRAFYEQALAAFGIVGSRRGLAQVHNNLALTNAEMGLYALARDDATDAVETARLMGARVDLAYYLDTLARVYLPLGEAHKANLLCQEGAALAREIGDPPLEAAYCLGLAHAARVDGRLEEACGLFQKSAEIYGSMGIPAEQATGLAWLGATELALGDVEAAGAHTAQAVDILEKAPSAGTEYPPQEVWWWRYQVLASPLPSGEGGRSEGGISDEAWHALDRARQSMFSGIAYLSDAGLRRNYLNKVPINRQIVEEWLRQAGSRGEPLAPLTDALVGPGGGQEQFRRMLDIGLRLNARREAGDLARFIVDQVVELTGAEQVVLYRLDDAGRRHVAADLSVEGASLAPEIDAMLDEVSLKRSALLRGLPRGAPDLEQRSLLCVPLVAAGRLSGLILAGVAGTYGRFTDDDRDLLTILANQAAIALENAAWAESLEHRVQERTTELQAANQDLEERTAELTIVNRVGQGLAHHLEFQAIVDLVGDELCRLFPPPAVKPHLHSVFIALYDAQTQTVRTPYWVDGTGVRIPEQSFPLGEGLTSKVILERKPLVLGSQQELLAHRPVTVDDGSGEEPESWLGVPIIASDRVIGVLNIQDPDPNQYTEGDVRLLSTLAASLGTALENARLFAETNRLLAETQQRTAELEIISSVQQGLAAQLDMQAIYDLVGDKIRDIFDAQVVTINTVDPVSQMVRERYAFERGEKPPLMEAHPLEGLSAYVSRTRQPMLINENLDQRLAEFGGQKAVPGTEVPKSLLYVPLIVGDEVRGYTSLQNLDRERAFSESDVRLLTTLASSMSVALENARLFAETNRLLAETQQRTAELEIINSVQQGLAAQLDMQAIYDLVGDKIREIFEAQAVSITTYDEAAGVAVPRYGIEKGQRFYDEPYHYREEGVAAHIIRSRQLVWINENLPERMVEFGGLDIVPGTEAPRSALYVPLIAGNEVRGGISLQNVDRENAFSESDVRLLTTLAGSMSVALENARLFAETNRLLAETQQRTAELEIISSVQQGLAAQLDMQAIYDLVGDKIRDIFDAQAVLISTFDHAVRLISSRYVIEKGRLVRDEEPYPFTRLAEQMIATRQPVLINEDALLRGAEFGLTTVAGTEAAKSLLFVPLIAGNEVKGSISLQNIDRENAFSESDVRLLTTLAGSMSVALENARLFAETNRLLAETQQRTAELEIISSVQQVLSRQLDLRTMIDLVGDTLHELFGGTDTTIALVDRASNQIEFPFWRGSSGRRQVDPVEMGRGLTSAVILGRRPLVLGTREESMALGGVVADPTAPPRAESWLGVPVLAGERAIGAIVIQALPKHRYAESDARLLSTITASVGVAIENARLFAETNRLLEESRQRAAELSTVNRISQALASQLDLGALIQLVGEQIRTTFQADIAYVAMVDRQAGTIRFPYMVGQEIAPLRLGEGLTSRILLSGEPLIINREIDTRATELGVQRMGVQAQSYLGVPIVAGQEAIGVLSVQSTSEEGRFDDDDLRLLSTIAASVGAALQNARLYQETQRRAAEMATLAEVGRQISATLDLPVVLERIAGQACEQLASGTGAVYLLQRDGHTLKAIAACGETAEAVLADESELGLGIIGSIVQSGAAECIRDTSQDPRGVHIPGTDENDSGEKLMVAPLLVQEHAIGALAVWRDPKDPPFNEAELSFAIGLAQQAAVAIENARLFEAAQESQRRTADIIDFAPDPTLVIDREGKVIAWNRAIEEMTGVSAADMLGKGNYEYALPFFGERRPILIDLVLRPDKEIEAKYTTVQRDGASMVGETFTQLRGRTAYLYATASVLRDSKGEIVGAIETIRDITDRRRAEEELRQAKAAAESATQAKSAFLATMSHEIRTPMNAVIGMTSLLLDTPLSPEQREFAETIRSSGDALLTVINDILDFSKIEAGRIDLERQPFDLRECVESALGLVAGQAAAKGLELGCWVDPAVPVGIVGDETRLRQILLNLLSNAIKFTEQGEVMLSASVEAHPHPASPVPTGEGPVLPPAAAGGGYLLHFSVRDTGLGIPPDRMDRLFQSFSQVDSSTTRRFGGTGLGLAISQRLAGLMGGRIWAESAGISGQGSTFHFTIQAPPATRPARAELQAEAPDLRGRHVLIVDDSATSRRILTLQTQAWGMLPEATASPAESLAWIRRGDPVDVGILDRQMPEMDGIMLAAELRKLKPDMPLVMVSSLGRGEAEETGQFAAFLVKPVRASQLYNALQGILAGRPEAQPVRPAAAAPQFDAEMGKRHPLRLLLAEDNAVNQKLALRLLERLGYRADVAANGLEAIRAVERQPYDLVFMDVQMPEMDGLEATRQMCARWAAGQRPRIVAMTANALAEDREACLAAGMDDYLAKPIRVDELVAALERGWAVAYGAQASGEHG